MNVKIPETPINTMPDLPTVSIAQIEKALDAYRKKFENKNDEELQVTFEYMVGSFYPTVYKNMVDGTKLAWHKGYEAGLNDGLASKE